MPFVRRVSLWTNRPRLRHGRRQGVAVCRLARREHLLGAAVVRHERGHAHACRGLAMRGGNVAACRDVGVCREREYEGSPPVVRR
jgi:hypothetical protein